MSDQYVVWAILAGEVMVALLAAAGFLTWLMLRRARALQRALAGFAEAVKASAAERRAHLVSGLPERPGEEASGTTAEAILAQEHQFYRNIANVIRRPDADGLLAIRTLVESLSEPRAPGTPAAAAVSDIELALAAENAQLKAQLAAVTERCEKLSLEYRAVFPESPDERTAADAHPLQSHAESTAATTPVPVDQAALDQLLIDEPEDSAAAVQGVEIAGGESDLDLDDLFNQPPPAREPQVGPKVDAA